MHLADTFIQSRMCYNAEHCRNKLELLNNMPQRQRRKMKMGAIIRGKRLPLNRNVIYYSQSLYWVASTYLHDITSLFEDIVWPL